MVDAIRAAAAHTDDPPVADTDVEGATVGAEDAGRLHPAIDGSLHVLVDAHRPLATTWVRRPGAPRVGDAFDHHRRFPVSRP